MANNSDCTDCDINDDRLISWRFFLNIDKHKNVLCIQEKLCTSTLLISQFVANIIFVNKSFQKITTLTKRCNHAGYENVSFVNSDKEKLTFKDGSFDIILIENDNLRWGTKTTRLHNSKRKTQLISALRDGGQLMIFTRNPLRDENFKSDGNFLLNKILAVALSLRHFFLSPKKLINEYETNNVRKIYFFQGPVGETYCIYGNGSIAYTYYCKNFTGMKRFKAVKKIINYLAGLTGIYRLRADYLLHVISK